MSKNELIKIFLSGPSDTATLRRTIKNNKNNEKITISEAIRFQFFDQEDIPSSSGKHPQSIINTYLEKDIDYLFAIFINKLGTKTGNEKSGTIAEINLIKKRKPQNVSIYVKKIEPPNQDIEEYLKEIEEEILYQYFNENEEIIEAINSKLKNISSGNKTDSKIVDLEAVEKDIIKRIYNSKAQYMMLVQIFGGNFYQIDNDEIIKNTNNGEYNKFQRAVEKLISNEYLKQEETKTYKIYKLTFKGNDFYEKNLKY